MLLKSKAIVLHNIKYSDNSFIVIMYTEKMGRQSFMVKGIGSKKPKIRANILQSLTLLNIEFEYKANKSLQYIKNIQISNSASTIIFDVYKSSIAFFWAEILYKSILEEEANNHLFEYVYNSIQMLDIKSRGIANLNIYFVIHLTKFLGFFPNDNYTELTKYFDIKNASFEQIKPVHTFSMDEQSSILLHKFIQYSENQCENLDMNYKYRKILLERIVDYYSVHINNVKSIKSLSVLQEVFH